jgi:glycosyltransferase involved in cell wall biosynthesis
MKILLATPLYPPEIGGPATYAKLLVEELPKHGIDLQILKFSEVRKLPPIIRHVVFLIKTLHRGMNTDIIFVQDVFSVALPALIAAKILHKPIIVRVPGDYAWEQGKQRFGITDSIDVFQTKKYSWRVELFRTIQRFVVRNADQVIAPSVYFARIVQSWIPKENPKKVIAIYNGIDETEIVPFKKIMYSIGEIVTIVSAGRMVPWKEFDALIDVLPNHPSWRLILIGDGPDKEKLITHADMLGVSNRVQFLGTLPQQKLWQTIAHADVFVLNSSFESFSYQAVEVMALGVPLLATNACNLEEIITHKETGILIPAKNKEILETSLVDLLNDEVLRKKIGEGGMIQVSRFTISQTIDQLIKIIKSIKNI